MNKSKLKEFFMCTRPHSYPASIAPVLFGATYALGYEIKFSILKFILFLLACLLIQAATNLFNEYYDYKHGLDKIDSEGISGSIVKGNLSPREVMVGALVLYALAFILGLILTFMTSLYILLVGLVCMLAGYFYTGGKYPIAYSPFGEVVSGFFMGTIIISLSFYFQTGYVNADIIVVSLPLFIMIGAILLANNIRDLDNDKESGRRTYAILVGRNNAIKTMEISFIVVYLLNVLFIVTKYASWWNLLVFVTIPLAIKIIKGFSANNHKTTMAPFMVLTAKLTIFVGFIMSLANILKYLMN
ncbi:1,4-dihydroxy-2-naphthoate polyprenyltransferase [Gemella haemolysans]|uniref:1,4-dihydroxy-2-naphthoate octaprenyltransferase n=1 Tax=Gemella haemolysans ATCC 10379 TaxID=546270 RepID=C5NUX4_9BACL|nr:1,4-dihydroxy-2-naphthoate polyprenyltransferase [Gemella haemolysans]EER69078.1 1,4-dihydroxy-2-naphthoate octaprenyltransferase [Gemella haemolysans ATCC 10379]KAA8708017.1 1,4-dihydroxy-2-naphthoate polyprenyltransferase [Gemella haemolysans]UBH81992.1 1,4-dihydroxy-2-naphthoate polyprenyltransferase [Gemella haemolysans]VEI38092.1 1,4-dihydroxy-2-naphthoate octaprenyltransferase [Gemella haemolysans]